MKALAIVGITALTFAVILVAVVTKITDMGDFRKGEPVEVILDGRRGVAIGAHAGSIRVRFWSANGYVSTLFPADSLRHGWTTKAGSDNENHYEK